MAPFKRKPENAGLPARWVLSHGAYYYITTEATRKMWDGKKWFKLGTTLSEAYKVWSDRIQAPSTITTISDLLDRYLLEVIPTKAPKTAKENTRIVGVLRPVFGAMYLTDIEPQHIYKYFDKRSAKVAAKRELEVLSHAFTKAVEWGLIKAHPFKSETRLAENPPRTRYVEDWELEEVMKMVPRRRKGSVGMVQAYLRLKLLTGLRQRDLLLMTVSDLKEDGIHVTPSKTKHSSGKKLIYTWTPELRHVIDEIKSIRPAISPYLFCNKFGACYVEEDGTAGDWNNLWQNFMNRAMKETKLTERFTEHDMRAKVGSDAESLERATALMAHTDTRMTKRVYRRKPEKIAPTK